MSRGDTNTRSVRFDQNVECNIYSPEAPATSSSLKTDVTQDSMGDSFGMDQRSTTVPTPIILSASLAPKEEQDSTGGSSDMEQESTDLYRDGIHVQLREPSVKLVLDGGVNPVDIFHESILNAPATSSPVSTFLINSRSFPWKITVSRQNGSLTVHDVLDGIIKYLQRPAHKELVELWRNDLDLFLQVDKRRKKRLEKKGNWDDTSPRWIDWLPSREHVFFGLSLEKGSSADSTERILKVTSNLTFT
ncbi:hypothetical protein C0993_008228 [Termitomyces sp. T159_Od127]|nr:hypothetical protein C0993_008228 [Termitomyces sp. T159_Od127]